MFTGFLQTRQQTTQRQSDCTLITPFFLTYRLTLQKPVHAGKHGTKWNIHLGVQFLFYSNLPSFSVGFAWSCAWGIGLSKSAPVVPATSANSSSDTNTEKNGKRQPVLPGNAVHAEPLQRSEIWDRDWEVENCLHMVKDRDCGEDKHGCGSEWGKAGRSWRTSPYRSRGWSDRENEPSKKYENAVILIRYLSQENSDGCGKLVRRLPQSLGMVEIALTKRTQ